MSPLFGPPRSWPDDDLIAVSHNFDADLVVQAYTEGVFPMPLAELMGWFSPVARGILPLDGLRVSRSLRKMRHRYRITIDTAFDAVLARCADLARPGAWIDHDIADVYGQLHRVGVAHSVEAWAHSGELAGGLYGISLGGLFAGESMFHDPLIGRDASKVALIALVRLLHPDCEGVSAPADRLLDVQWQTPHLSTLGVMEIDRPVYLRRLARALRAAPPEWPRTTKGDT